MGHVNNAVYLTYLEQARFSHWRALRMAAEVPAGARTDVPGVILARVEIDYRRPAKYGDQLDIKLGVAEFGRTSFTYEYEIASTEAQLVATARTVIVHFDYEAGRPIPIPDGVKALLTRDLLDEATGG
jgi:acyl-CoA thioester hydrolase